MMETVAVLGCGPAGLLAAHAVTTTGLDLVIFSTKAPSKIGGAQFLHRSIPGLNKDEPDGEVLFEHVGDKAVYATKVYGDPKAPVSWDDYQGRHPVWNMRETYHEAWRRYHDLIQDVRVTSEFVHSIVTGGRFRSVLSCIPRPELCVNRLHQFDSQMVWISEAAVCRDMQIVYSGEQLHPWYRMSTIFGHPGTEYPGDTTPPPGSVRIKKPLQTDCDCWAGRVVPLGRYGQWKKRVLIHHAYEGAIDALDL